MKYDMDVDNPDLNKIRQSIGDLVDIYAKILNGIGEDETMVVSGWALGFEAVGYTQEGQRFHTGAIVPEGQGPSMSRGVVENVVHEVDMLAQCQCDDDE